jgi:hypothetical protein
MIYKLAKVISGCQSQGQDQEPIFTYPYQIGDVLKGYLSKFYIRGRLELEMMGSK